MYMANTLSTTITVAIITSLSTLAGVGVSGCVTFFIGRAQAKAQIKLADSSKAEQRFKERQQARRDSYVQFLNQVSRVEQALNLAWQSLTPSTAERSVTMMNAINVELNALTPHVNLIDLEGPASVSVQCVALQVRLSLETTALGVASIFSRNKIGAIATNNQEIFRKNFLERLEIKASLTKKMQAALNVSSISLRCSCLRESSTQQRSTAPMRVTAVLGIGAHQHWAVPSSSAGTARPCPSW